MKNYEDMILSPRSDRSDEGTERSVTKVPEKVSPVGEDPASWAERD